MCALYSFVKVRCAHFPELKVNKIRKLAILLHRFHNPLTLHSFFFQHHPLILYSSQLFFAGDFPPFFIFTCLSLTRKNGTGTNSCIISEMLLACIFTCKRCELHWSSLQPPLLLLMLLQCFSPVLEVI